MENFNDLFKKDLIFCGNHYNNKYECFEEVSEQLIKKGYVKASFINAIKKREKAYPTGLHTDHFQVAIPHTDPEHVIEPFIAVVKPQSALKFYEMGTDGNEIYTKILFMLGITKSEGQVNLLQRLIDLFQKKEIMDELLKNNNTESIYQLLRNNIEFKGGIYS